MKLHFYTEAPTLIIKNDKLDAEDYQQIADIWLADNLETFKYDIPAEYFQERLESVAAHFPKTDMYVEKQGDDVLGFASVEGDFIKGIFVSQQHLREGIGSELLAAVKQDHDGLLLDLWWKNPNALRFYLAKDFKVDNDHYDKTTDQAVYEMEWGAKKKRPN